MATSTYTSRMRLALLVFATNVGVRVAEGGGDAITLAGGALAAASRAEFPQVLAHRGASGYIPEHSLGAYETAMNLQTDYIEPDLCLTKDGVFVALHDLLLDDTTNVAELPQFATYKSTKLVEGKSMTGWFVSDFTYSETQELRLRQRLPFRTQVYNDFFTLPTLDQIISLAHDNFNSTNRLVGLYIELKHPAYYTGLGFNMPELLLRQLEAAGFQVGADAPKDLHQVLPLVIQCFDADTLRYLASLDSAIPRVQLLDPPTPEQLADGTYWSAESLKQIATYAQAVGPEKTFFSAPPLAEGQAAVKAAEQAGLLMHPWTFRAEPQYIGKKFSTFAEEQTYFYCCLGVAALFTEFPDQTRQVLQAGCTSTTCQGAGYDQLKL